MLRSRDLKYVRRLRNGRLYEELYDLRNDPDEFVNAYDRAGQVDGYAAMRAEIERVERESQIDKLIFHEGETTGAPYWAKMD